MTGKMMNNPEMEGQGELRETGGKAAQQGEARPRESGREY